MRRWALGLVLPAWAGCAAAQPIDVPVVLPPTGGAANGIYDVVREPQRGLDESDAIVSKPGGAPL